jgi:hypothetical protein
MRRLPNGTYISAERVYPSGAWRLSALEDCGYISRQYVGYTQRQADRLFRAELRRLLSTFHASEG